VRQPPAEAYPGSLVDRLERERRRRSFAVPGSAADEDARMEALFLERQLSGGLGAARWPIEEPPESLSQTGDASDAIGTSKVSD
jgi:hypothetical protein